MVFVTDTRCQERRLKNAEKQILPEALDLHLPVGGNAQVQQHVAEIQQIKQVVK